MKEGLRKIIFQLLAASKLPSLVRNIKQKKTVTVIVFHNPTVAKMEEFIRYYKDTYTVISLQEYIAARKNNTLGSLPFYPLVITLDDGHINNYLLSHCIKKYDVPVTIFLCSSIVGTNRGFWFNSISNQQCQQLKYISQEQRLEELEKEGFIQNQDVQELEALNDIQINEMKSFIDFQCHSRFHPILPRCDISTATDEITTSKMELETQFNLKINAFAYPNGDYSSREEELCRNAQYEIALSLNEDLNSIETGAFRINRICIPDDADHAELSVKSSGLWSLVKKLKPA